MVETSKHSQANWMQLSAVVSIVESGVHEFVGRRKYVKTGDVVGNEIVAFEEVTYEDRPGRANMEVQIGDILCARMRETEKVLLIGPVERDCLFSTGFAVLRSDRELVFPKFLMYYLRSRDFQGHKDRASYGATQKAINNDHLSRLLVPVPPLSIQTKVALVLERADFLRRKRQVANQVTKKVIQSVFLKMFSPWRAKAEGWELWSVQDLVLPSRGAIQSGPFGSQLHNSDFVREGILAVGIDNVWPNEFVMGRARHITEKKYAELTKFTAHPGDVLVTVMGTVGRSCVFPSRASPAIITKHVYRISLERTKCLPEFLSCSINWDMELRKQLGASTTGAIVDGLTSKSIKSLRVRLPPFEEQLHFVSLLDDWRKLRARQENSSHDIDGLFHSLISKAFRRELRTMSSSPDLR